MSVYSYVMYTVVHMYVNAYTSIQFHEHVPTYHATSSLKTIRRRAGANFEINE